MSIIRILAEFTVAEENTSKAKELFVELEEESNKEDGCLIYEVFQVSRQENVFIVEECFMDQEAFDFHKTTQAYLDILKTQLEPLIIDKKVRFLI
jgi:quinol monooxygenase YgiN